MCVRAGIGFLPRTKPPLSVQRPEVLPLGRVTFNRSAPRGTIAASHNNAGGLRIPGSLEFQRFRNPAEGNAAQERLLRNSYLARGNTVRGVIMRYSPPHSRGGDNPDAAVQNYVRYVAGRMGISPDAPIDQRHTEQLAQAIREFETGNRR